VRLNALNYLLVGAALCLFYLGLLALSEFLVFALAYGIAAVISVALIGFYSRSILKSVRRAWIVSAMLGGVYAYLYFVVQLEDFALLAGTGALFATLAALMFFTRRFDGTGIAPAKR
jgi:inner membrane protein